MSQVADGKSDVPSVAALLAGSAAASAGVVLLAGGSAAHVVSAALTGALIFVAIVFILLEFQVSKIVDQIPDSLRFRLETRIRLVIGVPWCLVVAFAVLWVFETGRLSTNFF